jgi:hypothetical protein
MALFKQGDILESKDTYLCFTSNSVIKSNGELVMGAGVAKDFKNKYPNLPKQFGSIIQNLSEYNLAMVGNIVAIQTKIHYKNNSDIELIKRSIKRLKEFASQLSQSFQLVHSFGSKK